MSNNSTPYGLRPIRRQDGADWSSSVRMYYVSSSHAGNLFAGDPVIKQAGGADANGIPAVDIATAGDASSITGVIVGFKPDAAMVGRGGPAYLPASTAGYVHVCDDPLVLYEVQVNSTGATAANVGKNISLAAGTGSVYTGWSGWVADEGTVGAGATKQARIIEVLQSPDNAIGASDKIVVQLNTPTEFPNTAGI